MNTRYAHTATEPPNRAYRPGAKEKTGGVRAQHRAVAEKHGIKWHTSLGKDWYACPVCGADLSIPKRALAHCSKYSKVQP